MAAFEVRQLRLTPMPVTYTRVLSNLRAVRVRTRFCADSNK